MSNNMSDVTNPHYYQKLPGGKQNIDLASALTFNMGNAEKYICRSCRLNSNDIKGQPLVDLNKALWYLKREFQECLEEYEKRPKIERIIQSVVSSNPVTKFIVRKISQTYYRDVKDPEKSIDLAIVISSGLTHNGSQAIREIAKARTSLAITRETLDHIDNAIGYVVRQIEIYKRQESEGK